MATKLTGDVEVLRVDELLDVNPANVRAKKFLTDLLSDDRSGKVAFSILEAALLHANLDGTSLAGVGVTYGHVDDQTQTITGNKLFANQAHQGYKVETFSAAKSFNLNNGGNQYMPVSANTTLSLTNKLPGTYIIQLQNTAVVTSISLGASFGTPIDNSPVFLLANGDRNKITVHVDANNNTDYINSPITA